MTCAEVLRHSVLDAVEVRVVAGDDGVMKSGLRIGVWAEYVVGLGRWFGGSAHLTFRCLRWGTPPSEELSPSPAASPSASSWSWLTLPRKPPIPAM
jgi:hypothetical protein